MHMGRTGGRYGLSRVRVEVVATVRRPRPIQRRLFRTFRLDSVRGIRSHGLGSGRKRQNAKVTCLTRVLGDCASRVALLALALKRAQQLRVASVDASGRKHEHQNHPLKNRPNVATE